MPTSPGHYVREMRPSPLGRVFEHAEATFRAASAVPPGSVSLADRVWRALDVPPDSQPAVGDRRRPETLPACAFLADALRSARGRHGPIAQLSAALNDVAADLRWERRPNADSGADGFFDGHANAVLAGPRGLERRDDVVVGVSLMAPRVRYPDHQHLPEEFYVVLSPGQWRQGDGPWYEPGPGGVVYHPPRMPHAMRSGDSPLLALWFLWTPTAQ